jgi:hypothetical protein
MGYRIGVAAGKKVSVSKTGRPGGTAAAGRMIRAAHQLTSHLLFRLMFANNIEHGHYTQATGSVRLHFAIRGGAPVFSVI